MLCHGTRRTAVGLCDFVWSSCNCLGMARTIHLYVYTVYIPWFLQINHHTYGHIRCGYTVLANPTIVVHAGSEPPPLRLLSGGSHAEAVCWYKHHVRTTRLMNMVTPSKTGGTLEGMKWTAGTHRWARFRVLRSCLGPERKLTEKCSPKKTQHMYQGKALISCSRFLEPHQRQ